MSSLLDKYGPYWQLFTALDFLIILTLPLLHMQHHQHVQPTQQPIDWFKSHGYSWVIDTNQHLSHSGWRLMRLPHSNINVITSLGLSPGDSWWSFCLDFSCWPHIFFSFIQLNEGKNEWMRNVFSASTTFPKITIMMDNFKDKLLCWASSSFCLKKKERKSDKDSFPVVQYSYKHHVFYPRHSSRQTRTKEWTEESQENGDFICPAPGGPGNTHS